MRSSLSISFSFLAILFLVVSCSKKTDTSMESESLSKNIPYGLVIHGGAGTIKKESMTPEMEKAYRDKLQEALDAGYGVLDDGGTAVEAVRATIKVMEDSPLFNAGRGSVFNSIGKQEMDASIMEGHSLNAGAVAGVSRIRNPIDAAIMVKDSTRHVLLSGAGAEAFAEQQGLQMEEEAYFYSEKRKKQLLKVQGKEDESQANLQTRELIDDHQYGTVGCVAIDKQHHIAAGTSTGGMTNKKYGRIGDSPIIGAGNYANDATCGISCTGTGEFFMRTLAAHETSNLMQYKGLTLQGSLEAVLAQIAELGGDGGMIGMDRQGNVGWVFNTEGMFRGYKRSTGENIVEIYAETENDK